VVRSGSLGEGTPQGQGIGVTIGSGHRQGPWTCSESEQGPGPHWQGWRNDNAAPLALSPTGSTTGLLAELAPQSPAARGTRCV
jgi:hypothetical protein